MKTTFTLYHLAKFALSITAGTTLIGWPAAHAQSIPIVNASFEDPAVRPGVMTKNGIPGWQTSLSPSGVANLPASAFSPPSDGSQVGYLQGTAVLNQLLPATLQPNTTYVAGVDCFALPSIPATNRTLQLIVRAGGTPVSSPDQGVCDPSAPLNSGLIVFDTNSLMRLDLIGKQLGIEISSSILRDSMAVFDNVRLTAFETNGLSGVSSPVGLGQDQTARPGVQCLGPIPCATTLEVVDNRGVLLKQVHLFLPPGTIQTLDFPSPGRGPGAVEVVPRWFLTGGSATFSLEVADDEQLRTQLFVNWGDGSVAKIGNLSSGPVSLSRGNTGRLKVYCDGSVRVAGTFRVEPCQTVLAFQDTNGRVLKQLHRMLAPGTELFLDLTFGENPLPTSDGREIIIPSLTVTGGPAVGSFALLNSETGLTITQSYPAAVQSVAR